MLNWFQALLPREGKFFDLFEAHSVTLVAGATSRDKVVDIDGEATELAGRRAALLSAES